MLFDGPGQPLRLAEIDCPKPTSGQVLIRVRACGVCRTDLHILDGDLQEPKRPLVLGHEIVGEVVECGANVFSLEQGTRIGVPWLGWTCGACAFCATDRENLCENARFTGYQIDGGYAAFAVADARYCFPVPDMFTDAEAAPLLCAGLIGYRALRMAGDAAKLGLYGFGAAAHVITQVARAQGRSVFAFTRRGDVAAQSFALRLGAQWAGSSDTPAPEPLDAAIVFAPVGSLVPAALRATVAGGRVVCAGIHMSDIPAFPYQWLWRERSICSVANLTRRDGMEFLALAPTVPVRTTTVPFALSDANEALSEFRNGKIQGAAVLVP